MDECRRLGREGERATREGNAQKGIELLQAALAVGVDDVDDLPLLSAIYSQLGNAYYAQKNYQLALSYHGYDLTLSRVQKDMVQQAKAYSNISATYTMLNEFNQAITCADNVIRLAKKLDDKGLECRGLYNLGLAHLQDAIQGVHENPNDHLYEAVKHFQQHLDLAEERKDNILCGLAIGNLGNAYFYLGDYVKSIAYHLKRLDMARAVGDKSSMRRSFTNMGNAYVLLRSFDEALKCYKYALEIAMAAGRKNLEAQLLFSLGNVEGLKGNYKQASIYYLQHLRLARVLKDSGGEARTNSALAAALVQLNQHPKALYFLVTNYRLHEKLGEESMKRNSLEEIKKLVKLNPSAVIRDNQICLDNSFDPDNISAGSEEMNFDAIIAKRKQHSTTGNNAAEGVEEEEEREVPWSDAVTGRHNASFQSMHNMSLSVSLDSFIRDCARENSSSTPKSSSISTRMGVTLGGDSLLPSLKGSDMESRGQHSGAASATAKDLPERRSLACGRDESVSSTFEMSVGGAREEEEEAMAGLTQDEFFDRLERIQGNRIDEQRANPVILKDRTNDDSRLSDSLNQPPTRIGSNRRMSLGMATMRSVSNQLQKNVLKGLSSTSRLTNRLQQHSRRQARPRRRASSSPSNRGTAMGSSAHAHGAAHAKGHSRPASDVRSVSPQFRVPRLPPMPKKKAADIKDVPSWERGKRDDQEDSTLMDLIESIQSRRMDEQRANLILPGLKNPKQLLEKLTTSGKGPCRETRSASLNGGDNDGSSAIDDHLYELIVQSQAHRLEDQRSELGGRKIGRKAASTSSSDVPPPEHKGNGAAPPTGQDRETVIRMVNRAVSTKK